MQAFAEFVISLALALALVATILGDLFLFVRAINSTDSGGGQYAIAAAILTGLLALALALYTGLTARARAYGRDNRPPQP